MRLGRAWVDTALGRFLVVEGEAGVVLVGLDPARAEEGLWRWTARHAPGAEVEEGLPEGSILADELRAWARGELRAFHVPLDLRGTAFQRACWDELLRIPYGETVTYRELARRVGRPPGAARAVGRANGANPVPIVVPCHRVVRSGGGLGGYTGGPDVKRDLLVLEGARPA